MLSCLVVSNSFRPQGLWPARLLCPWDSPGKNTEWVVMPSSRGSSWLKNQTCTSCASCIEGGFFTHWATWKALDRKYPVSYLKFLEKGVWSLLFAYKVQQHYRSLRNILTPVLTFPLLTQPARQGLKYVIPSDPQTGSYSCVLQPQLTLQLPVRFLCGMVREGLREKSRSWAVNVCKIKFTGQFLMLSKVSVLENMSPWNQSYGTRK